MKIFWSWQSDTDDKTGRHFVRRCLSDAIKVLKVPEELEEPTLRNTREEMHLDHGRQGVSGSPDLAPTIFKKIAAASVFVCDVTLVAENEVVEADNSKRKKRLINSNVGIEYGYAIHRLTDERVLMVQNRHFGDRNELPFDLRHKAGPIQYSLAPGASKDEIRKVSAELTGQLVVALRPYLRMGAVDAEMPTFEETPATWSPAAFWKRGETLARFGEQSEWGLSPQGTDRYVYSFDDPAAFYLRVIPTRPLLQELRLADILAQVNGRHVLVATRVSRGAFPDHNAYGAICFEPHGTSTTPTAFTQLFQNGEIWGVSSEFIARFSGGTLIQMPNVENIWKAALDNWLDVAEALRVELPIEVEIGAVGIDGMWLPTNRQGGTAGPLRQDQVKIRRVVNMREAAASVIDEFVALLWDRAGADPRRH